VKLTDTDVDGAVQSVAATDDAIVGVLQSIKDHPGYLGSFRNLDSGTQDYIDGIIEHGTGLFRPHGGYIKQSQLRAIECKNIWGEPTECDSRLRGPLDVRLWDVDPRDWEAHNPDFFSTDPSEILSRLCNGFWWDFYSTPTVKVSFYNHPVTSNNDVILLHSYEETASVLPEILDMLSSRGYTFDVLEPSWR
jgi:peptidoglycan/xylan/chitin deacetylase (PgdA/CDA1 family)